jgi:toxin ParE1/3/4
VKYWLQPEAAEEHKQQVAYYEEAQAGLGRRYHNDFLDALLRPCTTPTRSRIVLAPNIRRTMFKGFFHFGIIYRQIDGQIQVLAIAHHRRLPGYWAGRHLRVATLTV